MKAYLEDGVSQKAIAESYGLSSQQVFSLVSNTRKNATYLQGMREKQELKAHKEASIAQIATTMSATRQPILNRG